MSVKKTPETVIPFPSDATVRQAHDQEQYASLKGELQDALAREEALLRDKSDSAQRQVMLAQEFEHRLVNSLQLIASLLSMQGRTTKSSEASEQLNIAARRVAGIGRVHHRLHLLDHEVNVEFRQYLEDLCADLSSMLFQDRPGDAIVVEADAAEIPTKFAIPLGFIVNELVTNSAKYAKGHITVCFEAVTPDHHSLTVMDDGPGLPEAFNPADSTGLGMKIVKSLVQQIGGELEIANRNDGHGAQFTVTFASEKAAAA